eukprot:GFUD01005214.1.p1 GENE.GFUD01005214.1~~GFUD01005214.1.p1  ORF type:complete len:167 (+),score=51.12 GFUD01005214.1:24-503(+)
MDLVQVALGQSGLDEFFSFDESHSFSPDVQKPQAALNQDTFAERSIVITMEIRQPMEKCSTIDPSTINIESKITGKVKIPEKMTPTPEQMRKLTYRKTRDLNNEASRKCRRNKMEKQKLMEQECQEMEVKKRMLTEQMQVMEADVAEWRESVFKHNITL